MKRVLGKVHSCRLSCYGVRLSRAAAPPCFWRELVGSATLSMGDSPPPLILVMGTECRPQWMLHSLSLVALEFSAPLFSTARTFVLQLAFVH